MTRVYSLMKLAPLSWIGVVAESGPTGEKTSSGGDSIGGGGRSKAGGDLVPDSSGPEDTDDELARLNWVTASCDFSAFVPVYGADGGVESMVDSTELPVLKALGVGELLASAVGLTPGGRGALLFSFTGFFSVTDIPKPSSSSLELTDVIEEA